VSGPERRAGAGGAAAGGAAEAERRVALRGVLTVGTAYLIWGLFPVYFKALSGVPPFEVLAHRIAWSSILMVALLTGLRRWDGALRQLRAPGTARALAFSAVFISLNWVVYIWAVGAGHVVEASLGYFVNPLVSVLLGVFFLKEPLSVLQRWAVGLAAAGVVILMAWLGRPPWVALALALTFALYGLIRKRVAVDSMTGLTAEVIILLPAALAWLGWRWSQGTLVFGTDPRATGLLLVSGVVTAVPLLLFGAGVRKIRLSTVGLLQYTNPTMQLAIAVFAFGEPFTAAHGVAFGLIWAGIGLYTWDALRPRR